MPLFQTVTQVAVNYYISAKLLQKRSLNHKYDVHLLFLLFDFHRFICLFVHRSYVSLSLPARPTVYLINLSRVELSKINRF